MNQLIEGLNGVEVVTDDFVVVGCGESQQDAVPNHDHNLEPFLQHGQ